MQLKGAESTAADIDDRRYVLQISHQSLKRCQQEISINNSLPLFYLVVLLFFRPIYLLAESEVARDEVS